MSEQNDAVIFTLTNELGEDVEFELLDVVEYHGDEYAVMIETSSQDSDVVILKIESIDDETETYTGVEDDELLNEVFEKFKEKNADRFTFE